MSGQVYHGGQLDLAIGRYGGSKETWLDLSTGINPNAYPIGDLDAAVWQRLPDKAAESALIRAARGFYGAPNKFGVVASNGTQTLIELVPKILKSQNIDILSPTYGEHEHAWLKGGCHVEQISDIHNLSMLSNAVVVVNPNNPDGKSYSTGELRDLAREMARRHGFLIIDEAFCDFDEEQSFVSSIEENVLIYRSFGKFFGLAGLRLGFLIANRTIIHQMENLLGPWCVSGPALDIGARALQDDDWIAQMRANLKIASQQQGELLAKHGFEICGANALFTYVDHARAKEINLLLLKNHVLARKFPLMPTKLRFGLCKNEVELARFDDILTTVMSEI